MKWLLFPLVYLALFPASASAVSISNISPSNPSVRVYEKYEVKFNVATNSLYPLFQYDTTPPPGVQSGIGVTVEGVFTANGKTWRQPGFFMTETVRSGSGSSMTFAETNTKYWVVRFSPPETGTYQVTLTATDASGNTSLPAGTFTATAPVRDGFIKVSSSDSRYFEFTNGKIFWPIGPVMWDTGGSFNFTQYKDTGLNFSRPWMGGLGTYSTNWARWKSSGEALGNEGISTRLTFQEKAPGSELSYEILYGITYNNLNGHRMWLTTWLDEMFGPRLKAATKYQVKLTYKTANIAGPRVAGQPYGFTVKTSDYAPWGDPTPDVFDSSMRSASGTQIIVNPITTNQNWQTITGTFTPVADRSYIYVYLDNVTSGQAYVDEFSMRECVTTDCSSLGGEVIRNPKADMHTYVEQRPAAFLDWQVEQGEANGVFFKYVVHDKNDWIQNHLNSAGQWVDTAGSGGYYQDENTKARWLLRQWYRYIVARWGYSTAVHSWELNNEGPPNEDSPGTSAHWRTAQAFAKFMHDADTHPHLATTSFWCCWRPEFWGNGNGTFPDIDYADLHEYTGNPSLTWPGYPYDMARWNYETSQIIRIDNIGKPVIRAETGITASGGWTPITELNNPNPGIWYHNLLWAQVNPGALFDTGYWFSQHLNNINPIQIARPFYTFIKDTDLNKGSYTDAAATSPNTKLRIYGQKNVSRNTAILWIQNSDHTWKNVMDGITSSQTGNITLRLNPNTSHTVQWWNTYTGIVSNTQTLSSNSTGDLTLSVTGLTDDIAVKITSVSGTLPSPTLTPSPTPAIIIGNGDANGDGLVNLSDITTILPNWLKNLTAPIDQYGDGLINSFDFAVVANLIPTPTPSPSPTPIPVTVTVTPTPSPTRTPTPSPTPAGPTPTPLPVVAGEWTQHGHDAQRTSYTDQTVATPWRWKWSWNGPNATGGISTGKTGLPRNVQPVTGGGRVYVAAGSRGVFALNQQDTNSDTFADILWNATNVGTVNSTVAYDADTSSVFVVSSNGTLYKLNSTTGAISGQFASTSGTSTLPLPPAVLSDRVFFSMGTSVYAINKTTMAQIWSYTAGSSVHTPPSYSPSRNRIIVASQDLYVHAINNTDGTRAWRVKPTVRDPGDPTVPEGGGDNNLAEVARGWPVIAESHGLALVKLRLNNQALWSPAAFFPSTDNATKQSILVNDPKWQALLAIDLDDGSVPFVSNVNHSGWGDAGFLPMGHQPVIKRFANGTEVAYVVFRGGVNDPNDPNAYWFDTHVGEMMLDGTTVTGLQPGYVRWIQYGVYGWNPNMVSVDPVDEPPYITMAGNQLFSNHWAMSAAFQINDRSSSRGSYTNPITSSYLSGYVTSPDAGGPACNPTHYAPGQVTEGHGEWKYVTGGFAIYCGQGAVYDQYWGEYAAWVVSNNLVLFRSTDGAIVALENGNP